MHNVFTEEVNKIALSSKGDKRFLREMIQTFERNDISVRYKW